jgi:hypothetical protein
MCLITVLCSVWLRLCLWTWFGVSEGLAEFQTLAVFLSVVPINYLMSLICQDLCSATNLSFEAGSSSSFV